MSAIIKQGVVSIIGAVTQTAENIMSSLHSSQNPMLQMLKEGTTPFKVGSVAGYSILAVADIAWNIKKAVKMKGRFKLIPSLKILASSGDLMGEVGKGLLFIGSKTPELLKAFQIASTTLGIASIAFQVFGLAANVWEAVSVRGQIREFAGIKNENPHLALKGICSSLGDRKIFRIVSKKQSRLIKTILQKEPLFSTKTILASRVIDQHIKGARVVQIAKTVLNILMVLGLVLLLVAPTPIAPILFTGMMVAMSISFITMIASAALSRRCSHQLKKLAA